MRIADDISKKISWLNLQVACLSMVLLSACNGVIIENSHSTFQDSLFSQARKTYSLNRDWKFRKDVLTEAITDWKLVQVPSSFETHEGENFDGVGWYRKYIKFIGDTQPLTNKRVLIHFQAAATEAEVYWNNDKLGTHLGGWTPFRVDVTDNIKTNDEFNELLVRLDEKNGHHTQGFLPVLAPHFGGLWQEVKLIIVPTPYIDDLQLKAGGNSNNKSFEFEIPLKGEETAKISGINVYYRLLGQKPWYIRQVEISEEMRDSDNIIKMAVPLDKIEIWSPKKPNLYEVAIQLI